jgi:hypothetical protein
MLWHICRHYIEEKKACLPALHQMSFWLSSMPFIAIKEQCWAIATMAIYFPFGEPSLGIQGVHQLE